MQYTCLQSFKSRRFIPNCPSFQLLVVETSEVWIHEWKRGNFYVARQLFDVLFHRTLSTLFIFCVSLVYVIYSSDLAQMTFMLLRRGATFKSVLNSHFLSSVCNFSFKASTVLHKDNESAQLVLLDNEVVTSLNESSGIHLPPLLSHGIPHSNGYDIELVDPDTWRVSSSLAQAWKGKDGALEKPSWEDEVVDESFDDCSTPVEDDLDFDEIEDMRIRGNLFYKLDRNSKEFEEYEFEFRGKKASRNWNDKKESKEEKSNPIRASGGEKPPPNVVKNKYANLMISATDSGFVEKKKLRTPTFNQLTGPYHEPFCLDIYISKGSVRACIVHRVTSNVVAVAHSISKDMKFDLASTRDSKACAAVGSVLAQRALADDIYDVIYTPRKGEKLEGKLQIVLQSVIDNGVKVKVKIKQRKIKKAARPITN